MILLVMNLPPGRRRAFRRFLAEVGAAEADRRERVALAEAETALVSGRGADGRAALAEADLNRGRAAGFRAYLASA